MLRKVSLTNPRDARLAATQERMPAELSVLCIPLLALHAVERLKCPLNPRKAEQYIAANVSQR